MKPILKYMAALAVIVTLILAAGDSFAQLYTSKGIGGGEGGEGTLMKDLDELGKNTVGRTQQVVYGLGGLGAIALGAMAFFGRFQWTWFFGLIGGLALIAGIQTGIEYMTGDENALEVNVQ